MADHHVQIQWNQITDSIIVGTNLCCTNHASDLYALNVQADIDLEEADKQTHVPMNVPITLQLPTPDHEAPTPDQLFAGTALLQQLTERGQLAYVHCRLGHGRSPTLVVAYLIRQGMSVDEAIAAVAAKRPEIHIEPAQREALERFAESL